MFRPLALLSLAALVAACAPMNIWYKPGASVAASQDRLLTCRTEAAQKVPVNTRTRRTPISIVPRRICDSSGNCSVYYDQIGGDIIFYDANEGLRREVVGQCMQRSGYSPVSLPPCPPELRANAPQGRTTVMPRLTQNACVIRNTDGTWQIVAPKEG